jgi:hypothetical protein
MPETFGNLNCSWPYKSGTVAQYETNDMAYKFTAIAFKKYPRLPFEQPVAKGIPSYGSESSSRAVITTDGFIIIA